MSPQRTGALVTAATISALSLIVLGVSAAGWKPIANHDPIALTAVNFSLAAWIYFVVLSTRDRMSGRLDELAGQVAALAEAVQEYGDQRETAGYVAGVREGGNGHLTRVK